MDEVMGTVFVIGLMMLAYFVGGVVEAINWRVDCEKAQTHVSDSKVYDCGMRK